MNEFVLANHNRPSSSMKTCTNLVIHPPSHFSVDLCFWYLEMHMTQFIRFGLISRGEAVIQIPYRSREGSGQHREIIYLQFRPSVSLEQISVVRFFLDGTPWNLETYFEHLTLKPNPTSSVALDQMDRVSCHWSLPRTPESYSPRIGRSLNMEYGREVDCNSESKIQDLFGDSEIRYSPDAKHNPEVKHSSEPKRSPRVERGMDTFLQGITLNGSGDKSMSWRSSLYTPTSRETTHERRQEIQNPCKDPETLFQMQHEVQDINVHTSLEPMIPAASVLGSSTSDLLTTLLPNQMTEARHDTVPYNINLAEASNKDFNEWFDNLYLRESASKQKRSGIGQPGVLASAPDTLRYESPSVQVLMSEMVRLGWNKEGIRPIMLAVKSGEISVREAFSNLHPQPDSTSTSHGVSESKKEERTWRVVTRKSNRVREYDRERDHDQINNVSIEPRYNPQRSYQKGSQDSSPWMDDWSRNRLRFSHPEERKVEVPEYYILGDTPLATR
jgi:hypothetical protein